MPDASETVIPVRRFSPADAAEDSGILVFGNHEPLCNPIMKHGAGDLWHSGLLRGTAGLLSELKYWSPVYWFFLNDADSTKRCVSWRVDACAFAIRLSVWQALGGFDSAYDSDEMRGLDLGYRLLSSGGIPLHVPELFPHRSSSMQSIPREDVYLFFHRHFKKKYRYYMFLRESIRRRAPYSELRASIRASRKVKIMQAPETLRIPARELETLNTEHPSVSVVLPTMRRQYYVANLLDDLSKQTVRPHQVLIADATPKEEMVQNPYSSFQKTLPLTIIKQEGPGACRQRNSALHHATGDVILFTEDDTRILPTFIENHLRVMQTYDADATNGIEFRAMSPSDSVSDLDHRFQNSIMKTSVIEIENKFGTGNSCVKTNLLRETLGFDLNYEGGFGEDKDIGMRLTHAGAIILSNPYSAILHFKATEGGFRWWKMRSGIRGRRHERQPWELNRVARNILPRPSPTVMYGFLKHYTPEQLNEWKIQYILRSWWPSFVKPHEGTVRRLLLMLPRMLLTPWTLVKIRISMRFARDLIDRGPVYD